MLLVHQRSFCAVKYSLKRVMKKIKRNKNSLMRLAIIFLQYNR